MGFGSSNGLGFVGLVREHLILEPREGIESKFHRFGLEVVREGEVLTQSFLDLRLPSELGGFLEN